MASNQEGGASAMTFQLKKSNSDSAKETRRDNTEAHDGDIPLISCEPADTKLSPGQIIATNIMTYVLTTKTNFHNGVLTFAANRRADKSRVTIDFERMDDRERKSSRLESEAYVACLLCNHTDPTLLRFLLAVNDFAMHEPWRYTVTPAHSKTIKEYLKEAHADEENDVDKKTLMKIAVHMFLGVESLHSVKVIHGDIRPDNFVIGEGRNNRKVVLGGFYASVSRVRDMPKAAEITDVTYLSRGRQRGYEYTEKDDIESWLYCVAEMFDIHLLPWHYVHKDKYLGKDDSKRDADILKFKRAFCDGKLWSAMKESLFEEFNHILDLAKTKATEPTKSTEIKNTLLTACVREDVDPFSLLPWIKTNGGRMVQQSNVKVAAEHLKDAFDVIENCVFTDEKKP